MIARKVTRKWSAEDVTPQEAAAKEQQVEDAYKALKNTEGGGE